MSNELNQDVATKAALFDRIFEGTIEFHSPNEKAVAINQLSQRYNLPPSPDKSLLASMFPHYHRDTNGLASMDIYMIMHLFGVTDDSGSLHHALKKLMVSGERGSNPAIQDTKEAILSLIRYMEIHYPQEASALIREIACHFAKLQGWKTAAGNPIGTKL